MFVFLNLSEFFNVVYIFTDVLRSRQLSVLEQGGLVRSMGIETLSYGTTTCDGPDNQIDQIHTNLAICQALQELQ